MLDVLRAAFTPAGCCDSWCWRAASACLRSSTSITELHLKMLIVPLTHIAFALGVVVAGTFASAMARERAAQEAAARAAAAAVASARILQQERAKDEAWRRRASGAPALEV